MIYIFTIILLNLLVCRKAINYGLVVDDATVMKLTPFPVKKFKVESILLHTLVSVYIYVAFGTIPAFITALLFSVHPVGVQISCWASSRDYGSNALIFLMVFALAPFSAPLYLLTAGIVANSLFTPLVFIFTDRWYLALLFPIGAIMSYKAIFGNVTSKIKGGGFFDAPGLPQDFTLHKFKWINLIVVVKTFGYYALHSLLPIKNGYYNSYLCTMGTQLVNYGVKTKTKSRKEVEYWHSINRHFWGGLFAIVLMASVWWFNKFNVTGMGIMIFVTSLIPFLNFITVQQWTAPRYQYLPLVGFQIALCSMLWQLGIPGYCIMPALFLYYLDRNLRVQRHYSKDSATMFEHEAEEYPDNPRIWYFRYEYQLHKGNPVMAWAEAAYGLKHLPCDCQLWFGLACADYELGDMNATLEHLKLSEKFMMQTERLNMQEIIEELRSRAMAKLEKKWGK